MNLREEQAAMRARQQRRAPNNTAPEIEEFIDYLRIERGLSENTITSYSFDLCRLVSFLETRGRSPIDASRDDIRAYLVSLCDSKLSGNSAARHYAAVRVFYKFLRYAGKVPATATRGIRAPKIHLGLVESVPDADVAKMLGHLAALPESPIVLRDRAMIQTFYDSGLRVSELISLRMSDLDFRQEALRVIGKGDKQRLAPMSPPQANGLKAYLERGRPALIREQKEHGILFVSAPYKGGKGGGHSLTRQWLFLTVQRLGRAVLGRSIHPHQLRHSFGSTLVEHGADPRTVQALLGHADIDTTMRYVHVDLRTLVETHTNCHPRGEDNHAGSFHPTLFAVPAKREPKPEHGQDVPECA
jgi:integrase/recombinase XerD